ncbi:winged helix-turn-helix domain-containing protein [Alicyclobacillus sp. ALC3]|uniref:winged helix-turn-helix domain-containing protein n=1 Tax=Alicyclobacillus sp. ALC3 TaxID=2796143 RepID=UPI002379F719|nr:crosslink repair DNA glycosylase YcaQ family protein [Alicyclobacillus sp. ALC3]WDL98401.1 YcaQ family DNA glycosylase [Alicyclobacillus sp. ALC3]
MQRSQLVPGFEATSQRPSPDDVLAVISALECVQIDPVAAVERNQHLVLAARIPGYRPKLLNQLLETRKVFEYIANAACVLPMADYALVEPIRRRHQTGLQSEIDKYQDVVGLVLHRLESEGALPANAFTSADKVHGYWDNQVAKTKATSHVLNLLNDTGIIRVVKRDGNTRFFDISRNSLPEDVWQQSRVIETADAQRLLLEKYMRAYRVLDASDARFGWSHWKAQERSRILESYVSQGKVVPLAVAECRTPYYVLAEDVDALQRMEMDLRGDLEPFSDIRVPRSVAVAGRAIRFLPPLDNLLWRRSRVVDLFSFDYKWEVYTPAVKRQYGYYTMPILAGDELIGRIDPRLDRKQGALVVEGLYLEPNIKRTQKLSKSLEVALDRFARFHGVNEVVGAHSAGSADT